MTHLTNAALPPLIREFAPSKVIDMVFGLAHESIRIYPTESDSFFAASKFGGAPDLPASSPWPTDQAGDLSFLVQIDLAQLSRFQDVALPASGMLYFFIGPPYSRPYSIDSFVSSVVCSRATLPDLRPAATPAGATEYQSRGLSFGEQITIPDWDSLEFACLSLTRQDREQYLELQEVLAEAQGDQLDDMPLHRLLGWPDQIQGDMRIDCNSLAADQMLIGTASDGPLSKIDRTHASQDWELLLQIDTDDRLGTSWGDSGRLYSWIRRTELRVGNFENTLALMQDA